MFWGLSRDPCLTDLRGLTDLADVRSQMNRGKEVSLQSRRLYHSAVGSSNLRSTASTALSLGSRWAHHTTHRDPFKELERPGGTGVDRVSWMKSPHVPSCLLVGHSVTLHSGLRTDRVTAPGPTTRLPTRILRVPVSTTKT